MLQNGQASEGKNERKRCVGNELAKKRANRDSKIALRPAASEPCQEPRRPARPEIELAIVMETKATSSNASKTTITESLFPRRLEESR